MSDTTKTDSMLTEIDHVAIAVFDLEAAVAWYQEVFGATVAHREVVESDGVEEALLAVADSYVQLLTPVRDDSTVAKYLASKGEGLHHIGYRVADAPPRCSRSSTPGAGLSTRPPAPACGGRPSPSSIPRPPSGR